MKVYPNSPKLRTHHNRCCPSGSQQNQNLWVQNPHTATDSKSVGSKPTHRNRLEIWNQAGLKPAGRHFSWSKSIQNRQNCGSLIFWWLFLMKVYWKFPNLRISYLLATFCNESLYKTPNIAYTSWLVLSKWFTTDWKSVGSKPAYHYRLKICGFKTCAPRQTWNLKEQDWNLLDVIFVIKVYSKLPKLQTSYLMTTFPNESLCKIATFACRS